MIESAIPFGADCNRVRPPGYGGGPSVPKWASESKKVPAGMAGDEID
jgi:hypothetical protein